MSEHVVWTQWDDLNVPSKFKRLSPATTPTEAGDFSEVTFYVPTYLGGRPALELTKKMPNLKVLQVPNAGYDDALEFLRPGIALCNGRGIHDDSTAELAVGLTIASLRGFATFVRDQDKGEWVNKNYESINDRKIGIVGFGSIGSTIARMLSGFSVEIVAFTQSGRDNTNAITDLDKHLPTLDVVILILPLTKESKHLFDARRLALMKDGALLVNVARGPIVDTQALIKELNSGRITAGLDVTDPEPLPKDHPLWKAKGVLISPHVGGNSSAFEKRARKLIESQLNLLVQGKPLNNVIVAGN
ncbi:D-3-phosphoglycerate dehydrogenase [Candidatus Nanopelagicus hibericus]|uniref:D-3-phosphoglycerate dehydrogenase n=1 Tax=Candidatus Nanopelagicus hibericus TaxID=1884915 RepID=A0A249K8F3_9ACTN|nr:2-hydroxyacid dehydrogenase [Candidatus Nanopelagicus hibericus]ASY13058.1 D-3-phosphoglycerate dehydrogenase [Candidatus Nanopelagicus hibericus]